MNAMQKFERRVGGRWTGVTFHQGAIPDGRLAEEPMKFCEAIKASSTAPIVLTRELMSCPGALRSFGWNTDDDAALVEKMTAITGLGKQDAVKMIREVPCIQDTPTAITVGDYASPQVLVSYAQPEAVMHLIYEWQRLTGSTVEIILSSILAACGWVTAGAHVKRAFSLSFGCPESRKACAIGNDRLIVGLPAQFAEQLAG